MKGATPGVGDIFSRLAQPFDDREIEWRIARAGMKNGRPWAHVLAYINARAARARLNSVMGPANWTIAFSDGPSGGVLATLALRIDGEWIAKSDGADITEREPVKGGLSSAFKRVCAVWGIGEHLYDVGESWAVFSDTGAHRVQIEGATYRWDAPSIATSKSPLVRESAPHSARSTSINSGPPKSSPSMTAPQTFTVESAAAMLMPFGKHRGRTLADVPFADLRSARDWALRKRRHYPGFSEAVTLLAGAAPAAA